VVTVLPQRVGVAAAEDRPRDPVAGVEDLQGAGMRGFGMISGGEIGDRPVAALAHPSERLGGVDGFEVEERVGDRGVGHALDDARDQANRPKPSSDVHRLLLRVREVSSIFRSRGSTDPAIPDQRGSAFQ